MDEPWTSDEDYDYEYPWYTAFAEELPCSTRFGGLGKTR
jgi:hypothetical protein